MKNDSFQQSVVITQTNICPSKDKYFESEQTLISEIKGSNKTTYTCDSRKDPDS